MRKASSVAIAALWLVSLVATATIVWHFASRTSHTSNAAARDVQSPGTHEKQSSGASLSGPGASVESLLRENSALRQEVEQLRGERKQDENERLRLVLRQALRQVAEQYPKDDTVSAIWHSGFDALKRKKEQSGGMFGAIDDSISLVTDIARLGQPAVPFLANLVTDKNVDMEEREFALFVLSHIRDKAALAELLKIRAPDVTELDYPYDLIQLQVSSLPTADIREFIPEINRRIAQDLGTGEEAQERSVVLLTLGLVHGDSESLRLMNDPRIFRENLGGAIPLAGEIHTPQARRFLQWVADNSQNETQVALAAGVLEVW
jgi:hypothetical protein